MSIAISTIDTLGQYAQEVRDVSADVLADTDEGVPEIVMITTETPAYDCCPSLQVTVAGLAEAPTSPNVPAEATARRVIIGGLILATYKVTVLRCGPTIPASGLPSVTDVTNVALQTQQDLWTLWNGLRNAVRAEEIFTRCEGVHFDPARPIREQGGCVGWEITIRAKIDGIPA